MDNENYFDGLSLRGWDNIPAYGNFADISPQNYFTLQFNQSGSLYFANDDDILEKVDGPHAWVTVPGHRQRFGSPQGEVRNHRYVSFNGPRCDTYLKHGLIPRKIIKITRFAKFLETFDALQHHLNPELGALPELRHQSGDIYRDHTIPRQHEAVHILEGLLLQLHNQPENLPAGSWTPVFVELMRAIRLNPEKNWDFSDEAKRLKISLTHFRRLFPKCSGHPPEGFLRLCRIEQAAKLLHETNRSVAEIAEEVSIPDPFHFSKLFKQHFHISPTAYRKEMLSTYGPDRLQG